MKKTSVFLSPTVWLLQPLFLADEKWLHRSGSHVRPIDLGLAEMGCCAFLLYEYV